MVNQTIKEFVPFAYRYFERTNEILGMVGFAVAFACIGTENPVLFAYIALLFIILVWRESFHRFKRRLDLLTVAQVVPMRNWEILKRCKVALAGVFVLSAVATGYLDKYGLNLEPESGQIKLRANLPFNTEAPRSGTPIN